MVVEPVLTPVELLESFELVLTGLESTTLVVVETVFTVTIVELTLEAFDHFEEFLLVQLV